MFEVIVYIVIKWDIENEMNLGDKFYAKKNRK